MTDEEKKELSEEVQAAISEIESYYDCSLAELISRLMQNPIVRHFKGTYYTVVGVGHDCATELANVIYTPLSGNKKAFWTRELLEFLSPVPESAKEYNPTGQERRFVFVENWSAQLDLVETETLVEELNRRAGDTETIILDDVVSEDWVIARVQPLDYGHNMVNIFNQFELREDAETALRRGKSKRKYGQSLQVLRRLLLSIDGKDDV